MGRRPVYPSAAPKGKVWGIAGVSGRSAWHEVGGLTDDRAEACSEAHSSRPLRRCAGPTVQDPLLLHGDIDRLSSGATDEMVLVEPRSGQPPAKEGSIGRGELGLLFGRGL
jgi:hypothetical protein